MDTQVAPAGNLKLLGSSWQPSRIEHVVRLCCDMEWRSESWRCLAVHAGVVAEGSITLQLSVEKRPKQRRHSMVEGKSVVSSVVSIVCRLL